MAEEQILKEKLQKAFECRTKAEIDLGSIQKQIVDAVSNSTRRVRVERLIVSCKEALAKALDRNEQLFPFADKASEPAKLKGDLAKWASEVTAQNDAILKSAREYVDQCPPTTDVNSQCSKPGSSKIRSKPSSKASKVASKTSSQRHRDLLVAQQRREEIERQNEAALRLTRQKQELELSMLEEENRKKLAEATLEEFELQHSYGASELQELLSQLSDTTRDKPTDRVNDWFDNTTAQPAEQKQLDSEAHVVPAATNNNAIQVPATATTEGTKNHSPLMPQQHQQSAANVIPSPPPFVTTAQQLLQQPVTVTAQSASPSNIPPTNFSPQFTVPAHHVIPNLSSWISRQQTRPLLCHSRCSKRV